MSKIFVNSEQRFIDKSRKSDEVQLAPKDIVVPITFFLIHLHHAQYFTLKPPSWRTKTAPSPTVTSTEPSNETRLDKFTVS